MFELLLKRRDLRRFFLACAQSQLGSGAAFVALVLIAYARLHSPWAVSLVLLADFLPGIVLAPFFGVLADRLPRRVLAVSGDLIRAVAFLGIALIPSFDATVALALLAGIGTALFSPAVNSAIPSLTTPEHRSKVTALYSGLFSLGLTVGPAITAILLLVTTPSTILAINACTFLVSAAALAGVDLGRGHEEDDEGATTSLWAEAKAGVSVISRMPGIPVLLAISACGVLAGSMMNVAEPLLAVGPLHAGKSGYSILVSAYGVGMVIASFINSKLPLSLQVLRRRWILGAAVDGVAMVGTALAPNLYVALFTFALTGFGNLLLVGPEMRLLQELVSTRFLGRVYSLRDTFNNIAFTGAFLISGGLITILGTRAIFLIGGVVVAALSVVSIYSFHPLKVSLGENLTSDEDLTLDALPPARRRNLPYRPYYHHW